MTKARFDLKVFLWCMLSVAVTAALGSFFTGDAVKSSWYESIKPAITPPNFVFPIAWTILFFLIGLALYFSWMKASKDEKGVLKIVFGTNLVLNVLWSALYFGMRNPRFAFIELIILWLSIFSMIYACWKIDRKSAYLLLPYLLWVSFAAVLNYLSI